MTTKERMVPSVEMARGMYRFWSDVMCAGPCSDFCADTHAMAEAAGLALQLAESFEECGRHVVRHGPSMPPFVTCVNRNITRITDDRFLLWVARHRTCH